MPSHVALLRGVNIGAHKRIAMADLRELVSALGYDDVATYVNSGNVVFSAPAHLTNQAIGGIIADGLERRHGLDVPVVVRSAAEIRAVIDGNPFPEVAATPKLLHVSFLADSPDPQRLAALANAERGPDDFRVCGDVVYLQYPRGLSGATFMPQGLDRALGVVTTSRNWNTVVRLASLMSAAPE